MKSLKLLSVSFAALALVACESGEEKAARFAENAQDYLDEGQLQRARLQFQNALQNDPNNLAALKGAAEVAKRQERFAAQLRLLQQIVTLEPDNVEALAEIARLNLLGGRPDNALERADQVLAIEPDNLDALTVKGAALVLQNNLDGASEVLEHALAQAPENAEVRNLLAARYVRDEDFERAQQVIDEGLAKNPQDEALLVVKLLLSQRRQDVSAMDETFAALIEASPENGYYRERYGEFLLLARRDLDAARQQFEAAIPRLNEDRNQAVGRLVGIIRTQEGEEAAEAALRDIVSQYSNTNLAFAIPAYLCEIGQTEACEAEFRAIANDEGQTAANRALAKVQLGERALARGEPGEAMALADEVLAEDPDDPDALTLKGKLFLADENTEEAIQQLRLALNNDPEKQSAMILLGLAYEADGRSDFAEAQLAQAIDRVGLSPGLFEAYRGLLVRNGKSQEAADLTLRFAQTPDATPQVQRESAAVLLTQQRYEEAEVVARSLLRANPNDQDSIRLLATSLLQQERQEEGLSILDQLSEEGKDNPSSIQLKAELLAQLQRNEELRAYLEGEARKGRHLEAFELLTQYEAQLGNSEEARAVANRAIDAFPENERAYLLAYNLGVGQQRPSDSEAALKAGIDKASSTTALRTLLANKYLNEGRRQNAMDVLMSLYEDGQLNDLAANNLAALMLDLGGDPATALDIAKRFEGTEQPFLADTLAWAYYKNGQMEKADEYSRVAVRTEQANAEIFYHRGVIAAATGDTEAARIALERALTAPGKTDTVSVEAINAALADL